MSFWEGVAQGAQAINGAAAGASQGLDLYSRYAQVKEQEAQRQRQQSITDGITKMVQNGEMKDPLAASKAIAQLHLNVGDTEGYMKYTQAAQGMQKVQEDKLAMQAYSQAQVDPFGAIDTMNQFNELVGNGNKFSYVRTPTGVQVHSKGPQGETVVNYDDPEHFKHDAGSYLLPYLIGAKDAMTTPAEVAKDKAQTEQAEQATSASQALLPGQIGLQGAQISAQRESASNSASERASRAAKLPGDLAVQQAQIEASKSATANAAADNARADKELELKQNAAPSEIKAREASAARDAAAAAGGNSVADAVVKMIPRAVPDLDGNIPPERDGAIIGPIAESIRGQTGESGEATVSKAARLAGSNGLSIDTDAGIVYEPDGTPLHVGRDAAAILKRVMIAKAKAATAAQ